MKARPAGVRLDSTISTVTGEEAWLLIPRL
jgi:hypothetical protein